MHGGDPAEQQHDWFAHFIGARIGSAVGWGAHQHVEENMNSASHFSSGQAARAWGGRAGGRRRRHHAAQRRPQSAAAGASTGPQAGSNHSGSEHTWDHRYLLRYGRILVVCVRPLPDWACGPSISPVPHSGSVQCAVRSAQRAAGNWQARGQSAPQYDALAGGVYGYALSRAPCVRPSWFPG